MWKNYHHICWYCWRNTSIKMKTQTKIKFKILTFSVVNSYFLNNMMVKNDDQGTLFHIDEYLVEYTLFSHGWRHMDKRSIIKVWYVFKVIKTKNFIFLIFLLKNLKLSKILYFLKFIHLLLWLKIGFCTLIKNKC